ncbi:hypothetical protein [Bradyrhizobium sp. USDA 3650]
MNGYGTVEAIYRQLGIGVIKKENGERIIFTAGSVKGGDQGFQDLEEGEDVYYRVFNDKIDSIGIARDVWKKHDGGK